MSFVFSSRSLTLIMCGSLTCFTTPVTKMSLAVTGLIWPKPLRRDFPISPYETLEIIKKINYNGSTRKLQLKPLNPAFLLATTSHHNLHDQTH